MTMPVKARGEYNFPSRSAQELYGDDQLVNLWFQDTMWWCSAAMFRVPRAMKWSEFWTQMVVPFASEDPDFDPKAPRVWSIDGVEITPGDDQSLEELGVRHKGVIGTRVA